MSLSNKFLQRLQEDSPILIAEGYLFELERRGFIQQGSFVPEVVLKYPEAVKQLTREYIWCGSEVVLAFTYYAHRNKLRIEKKESIIEQLNKQALKIARDVIKEEGNQNLLFAGNICNTNHYDPNDKKTEQECLEMFREQVKWASEFDVDFILAETFACVGEALLALKIIKEFNLPAVVNLTFPKIDDFTFDGVPVDDAFKQLKEAGADVVGINCHNGPETIFKYIKKLRNSVEGPISCIPIPYRTTDSQPSYFSLKNLDETRKTTYAKDKAFPDSLEYYQSTRNQIKKFGEEIQKISDVKIIGLCCGNSPYLTRSLAESLGRKTKLSDYSTDMSKHCIYGDNKNLDKFYKQDIKQKYFQEQSS